jgi:hypothetical protein
MSRRDGRTDRLLRLKRVVAGSFEGILGLGDVKPTPAELHAMSHAKLAP